MRLKQALYNTLHYGHLKCYHSWMGRQWFCSMLDISDEAIVPVNIE